MSIYYKSKNISIKVLFVLSFYGPVNTIKVTSSMAHLHPYGQA